MSAYGFVEFLLARIAEDEAIALQSCDYRRSGERGEWSYDRDRFAVADERGRSIAAQKAWEVVDGVPRLGSLFDVDGTHIARHDPARVLAECEAKRRIIELWRDLDADRTLLGDEVNAATAGTADTVLQIMALPYASHSDYRESWGYSVGGPGRWAEEAL